MSDYFTALTRSAGPALERRAPMRDHANIVEQDVERVADSPGMAQAASPLPDAEPATAMPVAPPAQKTKTPVSTASPQSASPDLPETLVRNAAVNAALRWVAADPTRQQASGPVLEQLFDALPAPGNDSDSRDAEPAKIEIQTAPPAARGEAQRPQRARTLRADATVVDRRADDLAELELQLHEERVEVSIGTIHLRVDAPALPAVVAQPMPAAPARPERREQSSSGFSRCRIPRL